MTHKCFPFRFVSIHLMLVLLATVLSLSPMDACADTTENGQQVLIAFDYVHQPTIASNQIALWIEDDQGQAVKTLLATSFTAGRRGYRRREMSLDHWVSAVQPETLTEEDLDSLSSATPDSGHLEYIWDFTDQQGNPVPGGVYRICLEGTLYWESSILYTAIIDTASDFTEPLTLESLRSRPDSHDNETMLQNVTITFTCE